MRAEHQNLLESQMYLASLLTALVLSAQGITTPTGLARFTHGGNPVCTSTRIDSPHFQQISPDSTALVTAAHCLHLREDMRYTAIFPAGEVEMELVMAGAARKGRDIAVLVPTEPSLIWSEAGSVPMSLQPLEYGQAVHAFSFPRRFDLSFTQGYVASPSYSPTEKDEQMAEGYLSVFLGCTFGCSGSALMNEAGEMVGILSLMAGDQTYRQFLAVPTNRLTEMLAAPVIFADRLPSVPAPQPQ